MPSKIKTIIIDDEPLAVKLLENYLQKHDDIEVVATCHDGYKGLLAIQQYQPDLLLLDIQMPKITGFEMLELIDHPPKVIFTTAFDEYAIKAFEVHATDYILKPIHEERLIKALDRIRGEKGSTPDTYPISFSEKLQRIVVKHQGDIKILSLEEILYISSADDYVKIHTAQQYYLKHHRISQLEEQLSDNSFIRIHRSHLVNLKYIKGIEAGVGQNYSVVLTNNTLLPISQSRLSAIKRLLKQ